MPKKQRQSLEHEQDTGVESGGNVTMSQEALTTLLSTLQQSQQEFCQQLLREVRSSTPAAEASGMFVNTAGPPANEALVKIRSAYGERRPPHRIYRELFTLVQGEESTDLFIAKIHPLQKVPALSVNGEIISDSHVIALYLCRRTKNQDLYPADHMLKAKVDQMLYFNATTLFPIDSAIFNDYFAGIWPTDETTISQWYAAVDYLEVHLNKHKWLAGNKMQLCDICCAMTLSSLGIIFPPLERHVKVKEWMYNLESVSSFEINKRGVKRLQSFVEKFGPALSKIK